MVHLVMSRMGVLNDYLAYLPTVFDSLMAAAGTKKMNVPFNEADLARIVLNSVPSSWVNQYNMTQHSTLPNNPRTLLNNLEAIKQVMDEKHSTSLKVNAKEVSLLLQPPREVPRSVLPLEVLVDCESRRRLGPVSSASTARQKAGPICLTIPRSAIGMIEWGILFLCSRLRPLKQRSPLRRGGDKQMAYLLATIETLVKKGLKKAIKGKKRKHNHAYGSSRCDSDSE
jgi:hypothetical protein